VHLDERQSQRQKTALMAGSLGAGPGSLDGWRPWGCGPGGDGSLNGWRPRWAAAPGAVDLEVTAALTGGGHGGEDDLDRWQQTWR
jgi:hypothetical protein